jgi:hypothetical protein
MDIRPAINHEISSRRNFPCVVIVRNGLGAGNAGPESRLVIARRIFACSSAKSGSSDADVSGHASKFRERSFPGAAAVRNPADRPAP